MADHRFFAAVYDRLSGPTEQAGLAERRGRLLAEAHGRVLEIGGGTGLNLPHYRDVDQVTLLEPDGAMRRRLERRLGQSRVPVEVVATSLEDAGLAPGSFDTVVCTLVLCTVPDLPAALATISDVLRPAGRLLFLEHVVQPGWRGVIQRAAQPVWTRLTGGCHLDRDVPAALRAAGFKVTDVERFDQPLANPLVAAAATGQARPTATAAARR